MGKKLDTFKQFGGVVVGIGVTHIVNNIIKNNTSEDDGKIKKFTIWAGGLALTGIAVNKAVNYFNNTVDQVVEGPKKPEEEKSEEEKA